MHRPRVFVATIPPGAARVVIDSAEAHHLARVLRLRAGDRVGVFDGSGREWHGRITSITGSEAAIDLEGDAPAVPEPPVRVTLAVGVLKGDQMDHVVRDATALGAAAIVPMTTAHVTVPPRAWKSGAAGDRWRRVAIAAAKQCGRATIPEIAPVTDFADVLRGGARAQDQRVFICAPPDAGSAPLALRPHESPGGAPSAALVLIGPEGGWSEEEIRLADEAGAVRIQLGPRVLRAELMPAIALASLWTRWGW